MLYLKFILFGALTALPYAFPKLWLLPWISLIPVICLTVENVSEMRKRDAFKLGLCFGIGYLGFTYHWFTSFYNMEFLGLTPLESVLLVATCWIGLTLLQAIELGFMLLIYRLIKPPKEKPWIGAGLFVALWVIFEWQENFFWRGVPWARLALTQAEIPAIQQSASLFGCMFVSGIIVAFAAVMAIAIEIYLAHKPEKGFVKPEKRSVIMASAALSLFFVNLIFGTVKMAIPYKTVSEPFYAAVIQGNISSAEKWSADSRDSTEIYIELTAECVERSASEGKKISMAVWPETVIMTNLSSENNARRLMISAAAKELGITIFTGAYDIQYDDDGGKRKYNAVFAFYPDGSVDDSPYHKQRLVPFGEFTPMKPLIDTLLPILNEMNLLSDAYTFGEDSTVFKGSGDVQNIGSLVCFDSIYETLTVNSVKNGAEIITLSTNDSWFFDSAAVYQHNRHACMRAIESGRYIVRAANTGVSSIISPNGEILTDVPALVDGYTYFEVSRVQSRTLYSYVGNLVVYISIAAVVGYVAYAKTKQKIS